MTYARRVDGNHRAVAATLRDLGWDVLDTSRLPAFVDFVAWHHGRQALRLIEVKVEKGTLTTSQQRLVDRGWPVVVVRSAADAVKL